MAQVGLGMGFEGGFRLRMRILIATAVWASLAFSSLAQVTPPRAGVTRTASSTLVNGKPIEIFALTNAAGIEVKAMTYGGIITSWRVPDRRGQMADIVLGYDDPAAVPQGQLTVLGRNRRPIRQPHREGAVRARWPHVCARGEQRGQPSARRHAGLRQSALGGRSAPRSGRRVQQDERGRRGRVSGKPEGARDLHADRQERARRGIRSDDRQTDTDQPDPAQLLQPRGSGHR